MEPRAVLALCQAVHTLLVGSVRDLLGSGWGAHMQQEFRAPLRSYENNSLSSGGSQLQQWGCTKEISGTGMWIRLWDTLNDKCQLPTFLLAQLCWLLELGCLSPWGSEGCYVFGAHLSH